MGIEVRPPSVNVSGAAYTPSQGAILHGLGAVKGVGVAADAIVTQRAAGGPFTSLPDFLGRVGTRVANKRVIEALASVGALDTLGSRAGILRQYDEMSDSISDLGKRESYGQRTLFGSGLVLLA
jgi:DNA polymerase-3 subunit alpha